MKTHTGLLLLLGLTLVGSEDGRCFLSGGGSTESFFVPENTAVGSALGEMKVTGSI